MQLIHLIITYVVLPCGSTSVSTFGRGKNTSRPRSRSSSHMIHTSVCNYLINGKALRLKASAYVRDEGIITSTVLRSIPNGAGTTVPTYRVFWCFISIFSTLHIACTWSIAVDLPSDFPWMIHAHMHWPRPWPCMECNSCTVISYFTTTLFVVLDFCML